jgi:hypothetical protein
MTMNPVGVHAAPIAGESLHHDRSARFDPVRAGAAALLLGGPLSLVFHALWRIGHGPTVVNEHGIVLGLTNDQWSHLNGIWIVPVALGVVATCLVHRGRLSTLAGALTVTGLALSGISAWVWALYSLGTIVLYAGVLCLAVTVLRSGLLPRWSGAALWGSLICFLPLLVAPEAVVASTIVTAPFQLQVEDVIASGTAFGWTALGLGLARSSPGRV